MLRPYLALSCSAYLLACSAEPTRDGSGTGGETASGRSSGTGGATAGSIPANGGAVPGVGGAISAGATGVGAGGVTGNGSSGTNAEGGASGVAGAAPNAGTGGAVAGTAGAGDGARGGGSGAGGFGGSSNGGASGSGGVGPGGAGGSGGADDGRIVLFDGTSLDAWASSSGGPAPWRLLVGEAAMEVVPGTGNVFTRQNLGSMFLHIEYWTPSYPASVTGQSRGNSGIYIERAYEFQVLDSFGLPPAVDTCGAIYGTSAPLVSACLGAETWNTYEIEYREATWNVQGEKTAPALVISAHLNGSLVQENVRLTIDPTQAGTADAPGPAPLMLQDHDPQGRVRYRNIWVIPR